MRRNAGERGIARRAIAATALTTVLVAVPALAAEEPPTREGYVAQVEPICKANVEANKRIFKGAKGEVERGELKKASRRFSRAAAAFAKTIRQMEAVPKPPADTAKLDRWFALLSTEKDYIQRIGQALAKEQRGKAESISVQLNRNSTKANNAVLGFGFDYCRIEPSRFS